MGTKEKLLSLLETKRGEYLSGAEIAEALSVSRTAVWKAAKALRAAGYAIDAAQNRGYCLDENTDILSESGVCRRLSPLCEKIELEVMHSASSTNALMRERANSGAQEGCVIIANEQTTGRGRRGRSFYSPPDTGIYMSILLRPQNFLPEQAMSITTMAAVAACEAIEAVSGREAGIKWVNDIYLGSRKVSGILTEATFDMECGTVDYIILGIGMNVYRPAAGFPDEISGVAGAIFPAQVNEGKNRLAAEFLNRFMALYAAVPGEDYIEKYREKSIVIGRDVTVITPASHRTAYVLDVDKDCRLFVRYEDGTTEHLLSAEISIRI